MMTSVSGNCEIDRQGGAVASIRRGASGKHDCEGDCDRAHGDTSCLSGGPGRIIDGAGRAAQARAGRAVFDRAMLAPGWPGAPVLAGRVGSPGRRVLDARCRAAPGPACAGRGHRRAPGPGGFRDWRRSPTSGARLAVLYRGDPRAGARIPPDNGRGRRPAILGAGAPSWTLAPRLR